MATLSRGERVLSRARSLMANKGYHWSRALELAAATLEPERAPVLQLPLRPGGIRTAPASVYDAPPWQQSAAIAAELAQQPPSKRGETQARALAILADELRRRHAGKQQHPSALWQARETYGITLADIEAEVQRGVL